MTICIAATCDDGSTIVVATDRMVSANFLALEFEHSDAKIDELAGCCVGLNAGDALATTELWGGTKSMVDQLQSPSIETIADAAKDQFIAMRQSRAEEAFLKTRGMSFTDFYHRGGIKNLPQDLAMMIDNQVQSCVVPVVAIIAGIDGTGAHIFGLTDPGTSVCYDRLGFHAVGSGETHALLHLVGANHHRTTDTNGTVFAVYEAKKHAELAQGVGQQTEMRVISSKGIRSVSPEGINILSEIYAKKVKPQLDEVDNAIKSLPFSMEAQQ